MQTFLSLATKASSIEGQTEVHNKEGRRRKKGKKRRVIIRLNLSP
jgi:hypothetical protein